MNNLLGRLYKKNITASTVCTRELNWGYESHYSSTELTWDLYVKGGDNVFNAKGRPNEKVKAGTLQTVLLDFQLATTDTSKRPHMDSLQTHKA